MYIESKGIIRGKYYDDIYEFIANMGVKQGDGASPELFTIFFDRVYPYIKAYYDTHNIDTSKRRSYTIASILLFLLAFADDIVLIAPTPMELLNVTNCFAEFCNENSLEINISKTEAMYVCSNGTLFINE